MERPRITEVARTIKVRRKSWVIGVKEEITELNLQEAKKLVDDCYKRNYSVFDTKTGDAISKITPNVDEITISPLRVVGGG